MTRKIKCKRAYGRCMQRISLHWQHKKLLGTPRARVNLVALEMIPMDYGVEEGAGAPVLHIIGKYRLLAQIGRGGMGDVYLAMAQGPAGFQKLVVLKCINESSAEDPQLRKMFLDEAMLAARLSHHNVVQTYEAGDHEGAPYIAMEYLEGQPLSKLIQSAPDIAPRMACHIISEAAAGLHYAHQLHDYDGTPLAIVHRDLSPPNIFITYDGVVKVVDFGIAKTSLASRTKTEAGMFKGKIAYMAPEQATHDEVDQRADIFSLGTVLWEMVAGKRLFREVSPALTLKRLLHDDIPRVSSARPDVDPELDEIIARALRRNPNDRYDNALQLRNDLQAYIRRGPQVNCDVELTALMSEQFAHHRQKVKKQIRACLRQEPAIDRTLPRVNLSETLTGSISGPGGSMDLDLDGPSLTIGDSSVGQRRAEPAFTEEAPWRPSKPVLAALAGGLVLSLGISGWMAFSSGGSSEQTSATSAEVAVIGGSLEIASSPPGAMVFVDGEPSGLSTPAVLKGLAAGRTVSLRLEKAGYQPVQEQVEVVSGKAVTRSFQLTIAEGVVQLQGAPPRAQVYLDDALIPEGTTRPVRVSVGTHRLRVEASGTLLFSKTITIEPGEQTINVGGNR